MKTKILNIVSVIICLFLVFNTTTSAATKLPDISTSKPLITYTYKSSGKVYAYKEASLKNKTGGYISCASDECQIIDITSKAVKVKYPVSGGTKTAWFSRSDFTYRDLYTEKAKLKFTSNNSITVYKWKGKSNKFGTIFKQDTCYLLRGDENSDWLQIIYNVSNGYKMGWIKGSDYKKILPVPTSIKLNKSNVELNGIGSSVNLNAEISPSYAIDKTIKWSSSNTDIATVSSGKVVAKGIGTVVITAKTSNGKTAKCEIKVKAVPVSGIALDKTKITLNGKGDTAKITAKVLPANATYQTIKWTSKNTSVATVSSKGVVKAVAKGTTFIIAESTNGIIEKVNVTVNETASQIVEVTDVNISETSVTLNGKGATTTLVATVSPTNATDKTVKWSSSDGSIVTVNQSGKITAKKIGSATITAKSANGKKTTCKVTVKPIKVTGIKLNSTSITLNGKGATATLVATVSPTNATDKTVKWSSSDSSIVTVNQSGKITAKKTGNATITVKSSNGKKATCKVTCTNKQYLLDSEIKNAAKKYGIKSNSNAYYALLSINSKYASKLSSDDEKGTVVFVFEGAGSSLDVNKRFGAMCVIVNNGKIVNINKNSSTIPDRPFDITSNDNAKVPTIKSGIYKFKAHNHPSKASGDYAAIKILNASVVRFRSKKIFTEENNVNTINVHRRTSDQIIKKGTPNSSGCIIVGKAGKSINAEYGKHIKALGIISSKAKSYTKYTKYVTGKIVIDRTYAYDYMSKIGYSKAALKKLGVTKNSSELLYPLKKSISRSSSVKTNGFYCDYKTGGSVAIYAPADGTVSYKQAYRNTTNGKKLSSYGNYIEFTTKDGVYKIKCCHLNSFSGVETKIKTSLSYKCSGSDGTLVLATKKVTQGELLGYSGKTGNASGHHLHLEVYKNGKAVNPTKVFTEWN